MSNVVIDFNVDEYVSEIMSISETKPSAEDLAEGIADIAMSQGHCEGAKFEDVVAALVPQIAYYM